MSTAIENRVWNNLLQAVEKRLNHQSFETWFRSIQFEGYDESDHVIHLKAPNQVVKDWVSSNYSDVIDASLKEMNLASYQVDWTVDEISPAEMETNSNKEKAEEAAFSLENSAAESTQ